MSIELVNLQGLVKSFPSGRNTRQRVLGPLSLQIQESEKIALVGPSGSGKSTLLRILAGLESAEEGNHICCGEKTKGIPPSLGFVFQQKALFPWLNAVDNVAFGLRRRGMDKKEARKLALQELEKLGLQGSEDKYPFQLSGAPHYKTQSCGSESIPFCWQRAWRIARGLVLN